MLLVPPPVLAGSQTMTTTLDKSNQRVKRMFGQIAPRYDLMNHVLSLNVDRYWRWRTTKLVPPGGDGPILDVCTGTGDLAFAYHRLTRGAAPITAVDFCPEMLAIGQRKKDLKGIHGAVQFREADAQNLPFHDNVFQIVCVAFGLRNIADTERGLREMARVARPGGRVAVLEFSRPRWQPFKALYGFYFHSILPRIGQWFARNEDDAYKYLPESVQDFPSGEALAQRMRQAGLINIRLYPMTLGIATLYLGCKP